MRQGRLAGLSATPGSGLERWFAVAGQPPDIDLARSGAAALSIAELLRGGGPAASAQLLELGLDYGDPRGLSRLRQAVVASGGACRADQVVITAGAAEALLLTAAALVEPGDRACVATPAYEGLARSLAAAGARVLPLDVWSAPARHLDPTPLLDCGPCRAVVVNSPHNPTGLTWPAGVIEEVARRVAGGGGRLVVDEVARATLDPSAPSVSDLPAFAGGAIVAVGDVSKAYGLGGLRIGWLTCADPWLLERVCALKDLTSLGAAVPSQFLAALALEARGTIAARVASRAAANRRRLRAWIGETEGAWWVPPEDGLVAFPRLPAGVDDRDLDITLREQHGVAVVPGALFDRPGHIRVGLGASPDLFAAGLRALSAAVQGRCARYAAAKSRAIAW